MDTKGKPLDQILYEAYCEKAEWKSAVSGAPLPQWEQCSEAVRRCWWATAEAAMEWAFENEADTYRGGKNAR